ncbi:hypothetical protein SAMN02745687_00941 [Lachnospiraceae bacterium NK3A20]|nr:hypothetical protein SAMN02745687_00941 [Lachnospiraceae bacterium NK3A20]
MKVLGAVGVLLFFVGAAAIDSEGVGLAIAILMMVAGMALCTICGIAMTEPDDEIDNLLRTEDEDETFKNFK